MNGSTPENALCLGCGYLLRGLPTAVCPECGRAFDPDDPSTYRDRVAMPRWRRWAKPPGIFHTLGAIGVTLVLLDGRSRPVGALEGLPIFWPWCLMLLAVPLLLGVYAARGMAACFDRLRAAQDRNGPRRGGRWGWLILPVCLVVILSTFVGNWALQVRFDASRRALETEAKRLLATTPANANPFQGTQYDRFVGLYYVLFVRVDPRQQRVYFFTSPGLIDPVGFVYSPSGVSKARFDVGLPTGWYVYED